MVCLLADLVAASGGEQLAAQGNVLQTRFDSLPSAFAAARRLQWAVQGFSEAPDARGTSIAVLVHSPSELLDRNSIDSALSLLEDALPGQILMTNKAALCLSGMPGFPLQPVDRPGLVELLWRTPDHLATRSFDEQILSQLIEEKGLAGQIPERNAPPDQPADTLSGRQIAASATVSDGEDQPPHVPFFARLWSGKMRWVAAAAGATVLALAFVGISRSFGGRAPSAPAPIVSSPVDRVAPPAADQHTPAEESAPSSTQTAGASTKTPQKSTAKLPPATIKPSVPATNTPPIAKPAEQRGKCDLDSGDIPGAIEQAEKTLARGKYSDAQRQFTDVLGCEPNNARARDGLERVHRARDAEDHSLSN